MNKHQLSAAYLKVTQRYELRHTQRDRLDNSDAYLQLMQLAHEGKWTEADALALVNNYFRGADPDDPVFELVS
jgi:hypothetical protein